MQSYDIALLAQKAMYAKPRLMREIKKNMQSLYPQALMEDLPRSIRHLRQVSPGPLQ